MKSKAPPLPNFLDLLLDTVFVVDMQGKLVYVSAACERLLGYTPQELIGRSMVDLIVPEDRERTLREAALVMSGLPRIGFENRYIRKDGSRVHIMWSARFSEADQLRIGVARDVTERRRLEAVQSAIYAISESAQNAEDLTALFGDMHRILGGLVPMARFTISIRSTHDGQPALNCHIDEHGTISTSGAEPACGHCEQVMRAARPLILHDHGPECAAHSAQTTQNRTWLAMPLVSRSQVIGAFVLESEANATYSEHDIELLNFVSAQIATAVERKQLHAELVRSARHDELTGLPNRRFFNERVQHTLSTARREAPLSALLFVDINDFKHVNDAHGHDTGDKLLQEVARRLAATLRQDDSAYRLGGDEFVVLLPAIHRRQDAAAVAKKLRQQLEKPLHVNGAVLHPRASIGVAIYPDDGESLEPLLKRADESMYREKTTGQNGRAAN